MNAWLHTLVTALVIFTFTAPMLATVTNVTSGGPRYTTITAALAAALPGDTLLISTGVYNESPNLTQNIALKGGYNGAFSSKIGFSTITNGGDASGSVIDVTGGAQAYLDALVLKGGHDAFYFGGGLDVRGGSTAIVVNCSLTQCRGSVGGALYAAGIGTLVILSNTAITASYSTSTGGGLQANDQAQVIACGPDSDIIGNYAPEGGGAGVNNARFELMGDADLYGNTASTRGGGALLVNGATFVARDPYTAIGYDAANANRVTNGNGGGVYAQNAHVQVLNDAFVTGNQAAQSGGGIYLSNSTLLADHALIGFDFPGSTNVAAASGGGIYAIDSQIVLTNGTHIIRGAADSGGGLFTSGGTLDACDVQFGSTNDALANTALSGAGIYLNNTTTRLANVTLQQNVATAVSGGGIIAGYCALMLTNVTVLRNHASQVGGLYLSLFDPATLVATHIVSNTASQYGGVLWQFGSSFTVAQSSLRDNAAVLFGGGYINSAATGTLQTTDISGNIATNDVGGLLLYGVLTTLSDCQIRNNIADSLNTGAGIAGGVYVAGGNVRFLAETTPCAISGNRGAVGGGVCMSGPGTLAFEAASPAAPIVIANNAAFGHGGGVACYNAVTATMYGAVLVVSNTALHGGGMLLSNMAVLVTRPTNGVAPEFLANVARGSGGGVAAFGPAGGIDALNTIFAANRAEGFVINGGGGVFARDGALVRLINARICGNVVSNVGGGILGINGADLLVDSDFSNAPPALVPPSQVVGNYAGYQVGGVYARNGARLIVKNTLIASNTAVGAAGGMAALNATTAQVVNTIIAHNIGGTLVDGIAIQMTPFASLQQCTIVDNNSNGYWSTSITPPVLENTIVWGHSVSQIFDATVASAVNFCDVQGGYPGFFNITNEPDFVNRAGLDYQLQPASPCIDAGATLITVLNDCIGNPRPYDGGWDIGAYEFIPEPAALGLLLCAAALLRRRRCV